MARKKKPKGLEDGNQMGALVQGLGSAPDFEMEHHADQLMHHAARRSRGYKKARRKLIQHAKQAMRGQNFRSGGAA